MDNLLIELMNRGFLIYKSEDKFVLSKTATPADPRRSITNEDNPNTSLVEFEDFASTIDQAKSLINWSDQSPSVQQMIDVSWKLQLFYKHRGLGTRLVDLGEISSVTYDIALKEAKIRGVNYTESYEEGDIESWDVKVSPQSNHSISKP